jgi:hypothetical protein
MDKVQQTFDESSLEPRKEEKACRQYRIVQVDVKRTRPYFIAIVSAMILSMVLMVAFIKQKPLALIMLGLVGASFLSLMIFAIASRKYFAKKGVIKLYNNKLDFWGEEIYFKDIASYQINRYQRIIIKLTLKSGKNVILSSTESFELFAHDFDALMKKEIITGSIQVEWKKSSMYSRWWLVVLIPMTALLAAMTIYSNTQGRPIPFRFYYVYFSIAALWVAHLNARRMEKE